MVQARTPKIFPGRIIGPHLLQKIALRDKNPGKASGVAFRQEILDVRFDEKPLLGAAVDLGTTNISLSVFNVENGSLIGRVVGLESANSLRRRCHYPHNSLPSRSARAVEATDPRGRKDRSDVGRGFGLDHQRDQVYLITVAGNTTMLHLLAGVYPLSLALAPFSPFSSNLSRSGGDQLPLPLNPRGRGILLPGISAYVGADIVAGLRPSTIAHVKALPCRRYRHQWRNRSHRSSGPDDGYILRCGASAGGHEHFLRLPSRARSGGSFTLNEDLSPSFTTIDDIPPKGICGSGLIDLTAALLGWPDYTHGRRLTLARTNA